MKCNLFLSPSPNLNLFAEIIFAHPGLMHVVSHAEVSESGYPFVAGPAEAPGPGSAEGGVRAGECAQSGQKGSKLWSLRSFTGLKCLYIVFLSLSLSS